MKFEQQRDSREGRERGSVGILAVLTLFLVATGIALVALTTNLANLESSGGTVSATNGNFLLISAYNHAFSEIKNQADSDGDGMMGSLGVAAPVPLLDSNNNQIGEYRTYVLNRAGVPGWPNFDINTYDPDAQPPEYVMRMMVAVPDFATALASPDRGQIYTAEAVVGSEAEFLFAPKAGAISISGPLNHMSLSNFGDSDFEVRGGPNAPAFIFTDLDALAEAIDEIGDEVDDGDLTNPITEITGTPSQIYDHDAYNQGSARNVGELDMSLIHEPGATFTAEMLNDYRDALRGYAQNLVNATETGSGNNLTATIDYSSLNPATGIMTNSAGQQVIVLHQYPGVKDSKDPGEHRLVSDIDFNSPAHNPNHPDNGGTEPESDRIVVLDTSEFHGGGANVADSHADANDSVEIAGSGTLVIMHPIGSVSDNTDGKLFNLNWKGDVIVIGYPKDRNGGAGNNPSHHNLIFLSRANWTVNGNLIAVTAGSTEASLEMEGASSTKKANLTVNGSLMMFAEATGQESEIDIESNANLTVNGIAGMFGSRIELEDQSSTSTSIHVNGTFTIGLPAGNTRSDDFYWKTRGSTKLFYDQTLAESAAEGLSNLQANLTFSSNTLTNLDFNSIGVRVEFSRTNYNAYLNVFNALVGAGTQMGVQPALIE